MPVNADEAIYEGTQKIKGIVESLAKQIATLTADLHKEKEKTNKLTYLVKKTNIENAKLFYECQALKDPSLNERQVSDFVEKIQECKKIEEVKQMHSALVNGAKKPSKAKPSSLLEALDQKRSLLTFKPRTQPEEKGSAAEQAAIERMQLIAGITPRQK